MLLSSKQGAGAAGYWAYQSAGAFRLAIIATLGNAPNEIEPGRFNRLATNGLRGDPAGWCLLFEDGRAGVFGDWRAGIYEVWTAEYRHSLTAAERAEAARLALVAKANRMRRQREQWAENLHHLNQMWGKALLPQRGDPVWLYMQRRGFACLGDLPQCLRFHPSLAYHHEDGRVTNHPAMLAPLVGHDGQITAIHRTYLTQDGHKAAVPTVRKLTRAAGSVRDSCIPLAAPALGQLGVAEGIETAIAARCITGVPTIAAYSASTLARFTWPPGIKHLVVFGDQDDAGRAAAERLQSRARQCGVRCDVLLPSGEGLDWADVWTAAVAEGLDFNSGPSAHPREDVRGAA